VLAAPINERDGRRSKSSVRSSGEGAWNKNRSSGRSSRLGGGTEASAEAACGTGAGGAGRAMEKRGAARSTEEMDTESWFIRLGRRHVKERPDRTDILPTAFPIIAKQHPNFFLHCDMFYQARTVATVEFTGSL
jgi:hypothetical protein